MSLSAQQPERSSLPHTEVNRRMALIHAMALAATERAEAQTDDGHAKTPARQR